MMQVSFGRYPQRDSGAPAQYHTGMRATLLPVILSALNLSAADDVLIRVAGHADRLSAVSRQIWETPELGFHENRGSALLQQELKANGFTVKADLAGMPTAFTAEFGSGGPVIGILGEFDALPGLSQKDTPTQSPVAEGAPGHGCGHNLLGSASALAGMPPAFTAEFGSGGPVIGILGEFDALPGLSQKDTPTQSPVAEGAPGHGCGHNLLGSASAL